MEFFYNFVNVEYDSMKGTLWLPVGFGQKNKYLPDVRNVDPEDMEKFSPIREFEVETGDRVGVRIAADEDRLLGLAVRLWPLREEVRCNYFTNDGRIFVSTEVHDGILSIEVPPHLAAPFIMSPQNNEPKRMFEIWFSDGSSDAFFYPVQKGRFMAIPYNPNLTSRINYLDKLLGDTYGKTL